MVLESPLARGRLALHDSAAVFLVGLCARPVRASHLAEVAQRVSEGTAREFLSLLLTAGMACEVDEDGRSQEERISELRQWEFHDLLFHAASRLGRHDRPYGATMRFLGDIPPLPALRRYQTDQIIELYRPDMSVLQRQDRPFTEVVEARRSIKAYGRHPITLRQLGEFLYRVARTREIRQHQLPGGVLFEDSNRPYPSGGASYELELYPIVHACRGLAQGVYHYEPERHVLSLLSGRNGLSDSLLEQAALATTAAPPRLQVLLIVTARFQRLSWKYESIAYATVLKDVGVLYQTMYLVATAMGLAPCAVGGGNADLAARILGLDYLAESSVGEFLLGSRGED